MSAGVWSFTVRGTPAPQGSKRFVGVHGGRGVMVESSAKVKPWRMDVKAAAEAFITRESGWTPLDGPLWLGLVFTLPKPASEPKTRRTWPQRKPDLSKLVRSTEDALVDAGLIVDDARIVTLHASKVYVGDPEPGTLDSPGCIVTVSAR